MSIRPIKRIVKAVSPWSAGPKGRARRDRPWGLGIMAYTYYGLDNGPMIMASVPRGKVEGGAWQTIMEGKSTKAS